MLHYLKRVTVTFLFLALGTPALAGPINIASWNVKRLGEAEQQSYPAMASIASKFDLIALQEVMEPLALKKLEGALEKDTGEKWGSIASHAIGSRKYKELRLHLPGIRRSI